MSENKSEKKSGVIHEQATSVQRPSLFEKPINEAAAVINLFQGTISTGKAQRLIKLAAVSKDQTEFIERAQLTFGVSSFRAEKTWNLLRGVPPKGDV